MEFIKEVIINKSFIDMKDKKISSVINLYFKTLIDRKTPMLYFNIIHPRYQTLLFTNAKNTDKKELIKPGNPDVLVKLLKVKNKSHWEVIHNFLLQMIAVNSDFLSEVYVINIFDIITYLKKLKSIDDLKVVKNIFNSVYGITATADGFNKKKFVYVEADIFTYLRLYQFFIMYKHSQKSSRFALTEELEISIEESYDTDKVFQEIITNGDKFQLVIDGKMHYLPKGRMKSLLGNDPIYKIKVINHKTEKFIQYFIELSLSFAIISSGFPNIKYLKMERSK